MICQLRVKYKELGNNEYGGKSTDQSILSLCLWFFSAFVANDLQNYRPEKYVTPAGLKNASEVKYPVSVGQVPTCIGHLLACMIGTVPIQHILKNQIPPVSPPPPMYIVHKDCVNVTSLFYAVQLTYMYCKLKVGWYHTIQKRGIGWKHFDQKSTCFLTLFNKIKVPFTRYSFNQGRGSGSAWPHYYCKLDPDPHYSEKLYPDPH